MPSFETYSDQELLSLMREGKETAFRLIYDRYWDRLYIIARKRLNDAMEAEEVVQDIFCNLWRRRNSLNLVKGFDNYFSIAVKYEVINRMAKMARAADYLKEAASGLSELDEGTIQLLDYHQLQERLKLTLAKLPEKCRLVFVLQQEQGYTQKQIAEELNISEKTVEAHLSKARKTLRGSFGNLYGLFL
ncbi:RNA polymerase sigma factor [Mucilaginibacter sp. Mucisp84]|uniref:RNA polymerase sigma factor n=1 Tax=Mucilaginibacter sp. Mucisp84 TaxID=3243058 RepID=UPI0039A5C2AA